MTIGEPGTGAADSAEGNVAGSREIGGQTPTQHDECTCEGRPRHIHHPWGWREGKRISYLDTP